MVIPLSFPFTPVASKELGFHPFDMGYEGVGLLHTSPYPLGCFNPEEVEEKLPFIKMKSLAQGQQIGGEERHTAALCPWLIPQLSLLRLLREPQGQGPRQPPESTLNEAAPASRPAWGW